MESEDAPQKMTPAKKESQELVSTVGYLLGFRTGEGGKLLQNQNLTKAQGRGTSTSNLENIVINMKLGSGPAQWETGALLNVASELELVKNDSELARLKRKFESGGVSTKTVDVSKAVLRRKPDETNDNNDRRSFIPPTKVVSNGSDKPAGNGIQNRAPPQAMQRIQSVVESSRRTNNDSGSLPLFSSVKSTGASSTSTSQITNTNREQEVVPASNWQPPSTKSNSPLTGNNAFRSAYDQLKIDDKVKGIERSLPRNDVHVSGLRRPKQNKVVPDPPPVSKEEQKPKYSDNPEVEELMSHESMGNIDPKMVEAILNEVVQTTSTNWDDIAGLEGVKEIIREVIIWPLRRPDIFTGLRAAPKGILFFGPPGTGKTMFGRVIANQFNSTFFNISASSLTSKWIGDGEKMVRALFAVARLKQPAVIFIDEIDSILTQRSDTEHESSRRLKTEFLIQFDGCATQNEEKMLVIGVTNRPQELDEAARRRFVKRIYIPLPDAEGRKQLVRNLLKMYSANLSEEDYNEIAQMTEGYSGADMNSLCREAAYGPIREVGHMLDSIDANQVRPMQMKDFKSAQRQVKSSVATSDVVLYQDWDAKFGCHI